MHPWMHLCMYAGIYIERHVGVYVCMKYIYICLIYLFVYLSIHLSLQGTHACMYVCVCVCWVYINVCISNVCSSVCLSVCLYVSVSVSLSASLDVMIEICLFPPISRWNVYASMRHASMEPCANAPMHGCIVISRPMCDPRSHVYYMCVAPHMSFSFLSV